MEHVIKLINQQILASAECKARLLINPKKYKKQIDICTEELKQYKASLLILSGVVRPNLTDKHPIEGVNEFMLTDQEIEDTQFYCVGVEAGNSICESQCIRCDGFQRSYEQ